MKRRLFALLLVPFVSLLGGCGSTEALNFDVTVTVNPRVTGTFETFYSDSYFSLDPTQYHQELALASHAMAIAAFPVANYKEDYATQPNNLKKLWISEGFGDIWCSQNYYERTELDSIGFGFARKTIKVANEDCTLIAVTVRGADYGAEWASNVTLGTEGDAEGFSHASATVIGGLVDYVALRHIKGHVKFWMSGYSRGAITTNMVAGALCKAVSNPGSLFDDITFGEKDIYAYCFEPPMGVVDDYAIAHGETFSNIHNLINLNDVVPLVAPNDWGFTRYGVDHYYPDRLTDIHFDEKAREKAVVAYHYTPGGTDLPDYTTDDWIFVDVGEEYAKEHNLARAAVNPSQARFVRDFISRLANHGFGNRRNYSIMGQIPFSRLFAVLNGRDQILNAKNISFENVLTLFFEYSLINVLLTELIKGDSNAFFMDIEPFFYQILNGAGTTEQIRQFYLEFSLAFLCFSTAFEKKQDTLLQLMNIQNIMRIKLAHMPELSYAWLGSCDYRYHGDDANVLNDGSYYALRVVNATHITIREKSFDRVIFESQGERMESDIISASYYPEGLTEIYLPKNGSYEYAFEGTGAEASLVSIDPHLNESSIRTGIAGSGNLIQ